MSTLCSTSKLPTIICGLYSPQVPASLPSPYSGNTDIPSFCAIADSWHLTLRSHAAFQSVWRSSSSIRSSPILCLGYEGRQLYGW